MTENLLSAAVGEIFRPATVKSLVIGGVAGAACAHFWDIKAGFALASFYVVGEISVRVIRRRNEAESTRVGKWWRAFM